MSHNSILFLVEQSPQMKLILCLIKIQIIVFLSSIPYWEIDQRVDRYLFCKTKPEMQMSRGFCFSLCIQSLGSSHYTFSNWDFIQSDSVNWDSQLSPCHGIQSICILSIGIKSIGFQSFGIQSLDPVFGSSLWILSLDPVFGSSLWIQSQDQVNWVPVFGSSLWVQSLDPVFGSSLMICSLQIEQIQSCGIHAIGIQSCGIYAIGIQSIGIQSPRIQLTEIQSIGIHS